MSGRPLPMPLTAQTYRDFVDAWRTVSDQVFAIARAKGFHDATSTDYHGADADSKLRVPRHNAARLALIHSEVSEALEAIRDGNPPDDKLIGFNGAEAELADVVIRVMDLAEDGWDLARAIVEKIEFNRTRAPMHGGKLF